MKRKKEEKKRFEDFFKKIGKNIDTGEYNSYKAFKKIYSKIRSRKSSIKGYKYIEPKEPGIIKLRVKEYGKTPVENSYQIKSENHPEEIKELALMLDIFLEDKPGVSRYFEGYYGKGKKIKMGTKDYPERFEESKKKILDKFEKR